MASLYRKKHSPYWFIQFIDTNGTRRNKSSGFRADDAGQTVKARAFRAQLEAQRAHSHRRRSRRRLGYLGAAVSGAAL